MEGGITPIHDRADNRGIGGGATDALLLQHLDQGRLAVAGRWLGLVAEGLDQLAAGAIAHLEAGQEHLLALQGGIGVVAALHVGAEEAGEVDPLAAGAEAGGAHGAAGGGLQVDRQHGELGVGHLAGHGALPDQLVEGQVAAIEAGIGWGPEGFTGGPDRFVGLLGVTGLGGELARCR